MGNYFDDLLNSPKTRAFLKSAKEMGKAAVEAGKEAYENSVLPETAAKVGKKLSEIDLRVLTCENCGCALVPGVKYCPRCGTKAPERKKPKPAEEDFETVETNQAPCKPEPEKKPEKLRLSDPEIPAEEKTEILPEEPEEAPEAETAENFSLEDFSFDTGSF